MKTATDPTATQSIVVEYEFRLPAEKVWRALTDPALVSSWLMQTDIRAEVGHRFTFRAPPTPGWDGVCRCEVLEVVPNERPRYSWCGGSDELEGYGGRLDTVVTWTLTRLSTGGTRLRLEHAGFTARNAFALEMMGKGWRHNVGERLVRVVEGIG